MDTSTDRAISLRAHEYLVSSNGTVVRVYCPPGGPVEIDGHAAAVHMQVSPDGVGVVVINGRQYRILFETDSTAEPEFTVSVNGRRASGRADDRRSLLRQQMRREHGTGTGSVTVKAPMPGMVLKVLVQPGQLVAKGDGLIVLEAMKMENEVKSDRAGRVESVVISERSPVEKGQPLLVVIDED